MELPDLLRGLEDVGSWERFGWGSRWELSAAEMERAIGKIDVQRNRFAVAASCVTIAAGLATMVPPFSAIAPIAAAVAGGATAGGVGLYELLKSRIKSADKGNGVTVDFLFSYSAGTKVFGIQIPIQRDPIGINISNVKSR